MLYIYTYILNIPLFGNLNDLTHPRSPSQSGVMELLKLPMVMQFAMPCCPAWWHGGVAGRPKMCQAVRGSVDPYIWFFS